MCGIVGVYGRENGSELTRKGLNLIKYRGLDGEGFFEKDNLFIGHCLHSVVSNIKQPFIGKGVFAINCEIYNWEELDNKYNLNARNDAELFFLLLENYGVEKTLELIDGDYSGVYFKNNKIYLFRDLIGVKPIWYSLENGFVFASERKVLRDLNCNEVFELNPRELLIYDIKEKKSEIINREFGFPSLSKLDYKDLKKELIGYLTNAITKRIPDVKFGLLFSGGIDSTIIAFILKELGLDFKCYFCCAEGVGETKDLFYAEKIAKELDLDLEVIKVRLEDIEKELGNVCKLIESNNVTKVSVALPFYFSCKKAKEDGVKVILSGLGSEELFAGYERHNRSVDLNKECYYGLLNIYEKDLYRDDVVTMYNNIELRVPFLDLDLINFALSIDGKYKINDEDNKLILREVACDLGLNKEYSFRKKVAAQYGSGFLKAIDKLSKGKSKSDYLVNFFDEGNVKLASLFSSGKDSCYAMYIMKKQNYDIRCLVTIKSKNKDSYMYHTPNIDIVKLQAEALDIPLIMQDSFGEKENELLDLELALLEAKRKYFIEGIVLGALFSNYQRERFQIIATKLGLKVFAPLWHKDQLVLLNQIISNNFEVILVRVAADGLDRSFLGKKLDKVLIGKLIELNNKTQINIAGEGGEYESLVLDCPMFKKRIEIKDSEVIIDGSSGLLNIKDARLVEK